MKPFFQKGTEAQKLLINALWKSGYSLKQLVYATEITAPTGNKLHGTWKITTGQMTGFYLNVSKKDTEAVK